MAFKKYKLPEVALLKKLGFKFEHYPLKGLFEYAEEFVNENDDSLFNLFLPDFDICEYEESIEEESCWHYEIKEADKRIKRLRTGRIETGDYRFVTHPVHKDDHLQLVKTWEKRKQRYGLDTKAMLFYPKAFGFSPEEVIHQTLLNELYRQLIFRLPHESFIKPSNDVVKFYFDHINTIEYRYDKILSKYDKGSNAYKIQQSLLQLKIESLNNRMYESMFENSLSTEERRSVLYYRILSNNGNFNQMTPMNRTTSLEDKESVIRHYLKTQSSDVQKARNTRGTGSNEKKRKRIVRYFEEYPYASISAAARDLKLDRKTVRKHKP